MLDSLKIPPGPETRYTVMHLARKVSPPFASVLVQVHASHPLAAGASFAVIVRVLYVAA